MRVLGIEGTAWCASAAVYDAETDAVSIHSDAYEPDSGGIHPREAAEHMGDAVPRVVRTALDDAREAYGADPVDAVAFSRGPGLGPCLRIVATAARALAATLDVPLVGVNHMVAHLEIGRHRSGFDAPVCLNASGANAHLLGYHDGRYRVLGETMDTGVGNAIDKFTRHVGWSHPGGPKVEEHAKSGEYVDLPYVVKGMDFSFSGIMSAAKQAYDDGVPVEDVCFSLQEHVFAMLAEVSERALSLTGADELVLGGGVGQNERLREMLAGMCEARGAAFYAPEPRFLRDNAGMIAVLGAKMAAAGDTLPVSESAVDPDYRPDEVAVTWRDDAASVAVAGGRDDEGVRRGAEATVDLDGERAVKRRLAKEYRHPTLDATLRRERTVGEARLLAEARRAGVPTPLVRDADVEGSTLTLQYVGDRDLAADPTAAGARRVGRHLARLHTAGLVHGDPTTRNVRVVDGADEGGAAREVDGDRAPRPFLVDFGLGYATDHVEDYAMDLHVFEQSLVGTTDGAEPLVDAVEAGYREAGDGGSERVLDRLRTVEGRGRYR
ncbi:bifunctional N(6)-L-threonylcarbamoyladenine synthase/serine/threonine protein kinase [Candidatus Halobonum tyrrellensis]|uniref:Probable bifunctional tRNA threonylcarbamoyladenosine biosynthesis protein n=1 Tax=Candidatus Halobonum tyrrellensis G22 TaxID=1324957 RepID=V4J169_9EURY|nr:bifunctional N(6)-L-threonylcarbamoyladenine synthase/serine/threonine protein kinase [Candidatus Halobonum tyrrellensis]ESP89197.1 bifunctional UGMP family protein/serine/threonine protein kinase [Candidatus Halobonum tyrrellensis G22]